MALNDTKKSQTFLIKGTLYMSLNVYKNTNIRKSYLGDNGFQVSKNQEIGINCHSRD